MEAARVGSVLRVRFPSRPNFIERNSVQAQVLLLGRDVRRLQWRFLL